jgi:hypothetical protein
MMPQQVLVAIAAAGCGGFDCWWSCGTTVEACWKYLASSVALLELLRLLWADVVNVVDERDCVALGENDSVVRSIVHKEDEEQEDADVGVVVVVVVVVGCVVVEAALASRVHESMSSWISVSIFLRVAFWRTW